MYSSNLVLIDICNIFSSFSTSNAAIMLFVNVPLYMYKHFLGYIPNLGMFGSKVCRFHFTRQCHCFSEQLYMWCYCPTALPRVFRCLIFINSDGIVLSNRISQISNKTEPIFPVLFCQVPVQEYGPFFYRIVSPFLIDLYEFFIKVYINPLSVCCMQIASPSLWPVFSFSLRCLFMNICSSF